MSRAVLAEIMWIVSDVNCVSSIYRGGSRICGKGGGAQRRSRLKTLFGISKGGGAQGACALFGPP